VNDVFSKNMYVSKDSAKNLLKYATEKVKDNDVVSLVLCVVSR
jgi:hypothetical protein